MARELGKRRKVHVKDLRVGHKLLQHLRGRHGKVLMAEGEILTQLHIDQIKKWEARPGEGRLSIYTRDVWCINTDSSGDFKPAMMTDPTKSHAVQNWYKGKGGMYVPKNYAGTRIEDAVAEANRELLRKGKRRGRG